MLLKKSAGEGRFVYFTEEPDEARQMAQSGFAVVGICYPGSEKQDWSGISYILELEDDEELEELEDWYVQEVWCRYHKEPVVIETFFVEHLGMHFRLREMKVEDVEQLYTLYRDAAIKLWITPLNSDKNVEKEKIKAYIENVYEMYGCGMWILEAVETTFEGTVGITNKVNSSITDKKSSATTVRSGKIVGRVGIEPCEGEDGLFLGYMIAEKMRGNHLAEKACKISLEYVKNRLEPEGIWCKIAEGNIASMKLAEKLGFTLKEKREDVFYYFFS